MKICRISKVVFSKYTPGKHLHYKLKAIGQQILSWKDHVQRPISRGVIRQFVNNRTDWVITWDGSRGHLAWALNEVPLGFYKVYKNCKDYRDYESNRHTVWTMQTLSHKKKSVHKIRFTDKSGVNECEVLAGVRGLKERKSRKLCSNQLREWLR